MSSDEFTFRCVAWSTHDRQCENVKSEDVTDENDEVFKGFKSTIRRKFNIPGDITFYVGTRESGKFNTGRKITDLTQTLHDVLGKTKVLIIRYDEKKTVAGGGAGMGANVTAGSATGAFAEGGMGIGGAIDRRGNASGGKAFGGDGHGEKISGKAGAAYGGQANVTKDGTTARAGRGAAGELLDSRVQ